MPSNPTHVSPFSDTEIIIWRRADEDDHISIPRLEDGQYDLDTPTRDGFETIEVDGAMTVRCSVILNEVWRAPALAEFLRTYDACLEEEDLNRSLRAEIKKVSTTCARRIMREFRVLRIAFPNLDINLEG